MSRLSAPVFAVLIALVLTPLLQAQRGAITAPRNLIELTDASQVIVRGFVLSATPERHPQFRNLKTVLVKVKVGETLKGNAAGIYTFRQFIWDVRDQFNTAGYRKGEEVLLMMGKPTRIGLATPVGLEQGRFRILRDGAGHRNAVNGHGNAGLFKGMQAQLQTGKFVLSKESSNIIRQNRVRLRSEELTQIVRELVATR